MVRPMKQGLDYFPMDVSFTRDVKVRRVHMACVWHGVDWNFGVSAESDLSRSGLL